MKVAIGCLLLAAGEAAADCPPTTARADQFRPDADGSQVVPMGRCGGFVIASDASAARFSWGGAIWRGTPPTNYELRVRVRRLTPDFQRTFEIFVPGGAVLVRDGEVAFYESEAQFAATGWHAVPGLAFATDREITLRHRDRDAVLLIGDQELLRHRFATRPAGDLRLALKGYRGLRSEVLVSTFSITLLP